MAKPAFTTVLVLANTAVIAVTAGLLVYSKIFLKRPAITEESERQRLALFKNSPSPELTPVTILFEPTTMNIKQDSDKLHYITVGFALKIKDSRKKDIVESLKPLIMDKFLTLAGHKNFNELSNIQGRYVLRSQMLDIVNDLISKKTKPADETETDPFFPVKDNLATSIFFTEFIVQ
ncbi:MAG: flagellar basal body-associated FliL family protein [Bdellovibrionota bacterium]